MTEFYFISPCMAPSTVASREFIAFADTWFWSFLVGSGFGKIANDADFLIGF